MQPTQTKFLSETAAAQMLSLSKKTLQRYRTTGQGPEFCKIGNRVVYHVDTLMTWALSHAQKSTSGYQACGGKNDAK